MVSNSITNISHKYILLFFISSLAISVVNAQCDEQYDWAVWNNFSGNTATGTITQDGQTISVEMTANYNFDSTPSIWNYTSFNGFPSIVPNTTLPRTTWVIGSGGETTMCFSEVVTNPILLFSSIGNPSTAIPLELSVPYIPIYDGGGMTFPSETSIIGQEGYCVLLFPGDFQCITILSDTYEYYTNITWGSNPPLFSVSIDGDSIACDNTTLLASGGSTYLWSGGITPNLASNTFIQTGNYFLTVTDDIGCTVIASVMVEIGEDCIDCAGTLNGTAILDECGECLESNDPTFNLTCTDCSGTPNGIAIIDECGECLEPTDPIFNLTCIDCEGVLNGTAVLDECGECLELTHPNFNQSCFFENEVYIPNAFSPNYDGMNDLFQVFKNPNINPRIITYRIFNRWGDFIFGSNDFYFDSRLSWWNGEFKGKKLQSGVYAYYIEIEFENGEVKIYKGDVSLMN